MRCSPSHRGTYLQPVGNVHVQLAHVTHAVIEDGDGLRGRERCLYTASAEGRGSKKEEGGGDIAGDRDEGYGDSSPAAPGILCVAAPWRWTEGGRR